MKIFYTVIALSFLIATYAKEVRSGELKNEAKQGEVSNMAEKKKEYMDQIKNLDPINYHITHEGGTEKPFDNEFWNHKEDGIYVDIVSGEALFSSTDKFDSGTGWPSFTRPINDNYVAQFEDKSFGMSRIEVKSSDSGSHLGHVFNDGPKEEGGKRFCINSGSLKFIHKEELAEKGYGEYLFLFEDK